jgi:uncharacterized protein (TIGR03437 family)
MRALFVFLLACTASQAQDFTSGQAARALIGQTTFTATTPGATASLVGGISGIAYGADTLFVADSNRFGSFGAPDGSGNPTPNNNRVMMFTGLSNAIPQPTANFALTSNPCPICVGSASLVLGQPDFNSTTYNITAKGMRTPTAVATDGKVLAVADTDNNRILIWHTIPTNMDQQADVVVGQKDFTSAVVAVTATGLRGPQGVWIQNGKLFVADTSSHRVLIYNSIPTANGAAADVVLGQPNFNTTFDPALITSVVASPSNMISPTSVSSDGIHLFVVDLGQNRVLIWNKIPTANNTAADVEIGQPDMVSNISDNSYLTPANVTQDAIGYNQGLTPVLCQSTGSDDDGTALFPNQCEKTLSFPRAVLAAGGRLFIADGGNDRVLIYNTIPTANAAAADIVLGEPDFITDNPSASANSMQTPAGLAWDGSNLYVSDTFNVRIMIFSIGENALPISGVRNAASREIFALGTVTMGGTLTANDTVTISIGTDSNATPVNYTYTVTSADASNTDTNTVLENIVTALMNMINGIGGGTPDANATASEDLSTLEVILTARVGGTNGANVTLATSTSTSATITASTSGATLTLNYQDATQIGPGTLISLFAYNGASISDITASFDFSTPYAPPGLSVGNSMTQVYIDGFAAPMISATPSQVNVQVPYELGDRTSSSAWVRIQHADGTVTVTTPVAVSIVEQNPGVFASDSGPNGATDPRPGFVFHASSYATGAISVDGTVQAGDVATITISSADGTISNTYNYTVQTSDTTTCPPVSPSTCDPTNPLNNIQLGLIAAINALPDPLVTAAPSNIYTRIELTAILPGNAGNGITYTGSADASANVIITSLGTATCCANTAGAPVTTDNPAVPGENLYVLATGLGPDSPRQANTGQVAPSDGSWNSAPLNPVDSILAGGSTANVVTATLFPGTVGVWQVVFQLNSSLANDPLTQLTIAQQAAVSNVVTFPVQSPPASSSGIISNIRQKPSAKHPVQHPAR